MDTNAVNLALLGLRVAAGVVMFAHGWNHLARMREGPGVSNWFESLGLHPGPAHAWLVTVTELAAGPLLVFGLLTPLGAAAVTGVAAVAWVTNHRNAGLLRVQAADRGVGVRDGAHRARPRARRARPGGVVPRRRARVLVGRRVVRLRDHGHRRARRRARRSSSCSGVRRGRKRRRRRASAYCSGVTSRSGGGSSGILYRSHGLS